MYKWYALNRIIRGVVIFCLLMFITSVLNNSVNEKIQHSAINEYVKAYTMRLTNVSAAQLESIRRDVYDQQIKQYKLDRPLIERILEQTFRAITFQFGDSNNPALKASTGSLRVIDIIGEALPNTLLLFTTSSAFILIISISLGLVKARKPGGRLDRSTSLVTLIVYGMPSWWLGMMLIMLFVYKFKLFPSPGSSIESFPGLSRGIFLLWQLILPMMTLVLLGFWGGAYTIRNVVLGILQEDFIMSARARGIPERKILFGHTMRTAAPPLVTMVLLTLLGSIGGGLIFEGIFNWPGLGRLYWIALEMNNTPVLMGNLAITIGIYQVGLMILDLIYGFLDPRIKVGGKA